jgi:uncharacterized repeat protein (TIGR03803 family)
MEALAVGWYLKRIALPLLFLVASACGGGGSGSDQVSVPTLTGLLEPAAFNELTAAGLMLSAYTQQFTTTVPAGAVISQSPAAGTAVSKGTEVSLVISEGPPITVPNVVGETQAAATAGCSNADLAFVASSQFSSTIAVGVIISQSPSAGSMVSANTEVSGVISLGPAIPVPNVVGNTQAVALTAITGAGLAGGTITQGFSATIPVGSVISQSPSADTDAAAGTPVNLVISSYAPVLVPNVVGESRSAAIAAMAAAGLSVGEVMLVASGTSPAGEVASENPAAGTGVKGGSAVSLTISAGSALAETVLHSFLGNTVGVKTSTDGAIPLELIQGSDGNFYGVSSGGGADSQGTLFRVTPSGAESVVYAFGTRQSGDGDGPNSIIQGADGSFYGTTFGGGSAHGGTVYRISPSGSEAVLYSFQGYTNPNDGIGPLSLVQGGDDNLYGITSCGSEVNSDTCITGGIFFEVTMQGAETVLHSFGSGTDGTQPSGNVLLGKDGSFYGTTSGGGAYGGGVVFRITTTGAETVLYSFGASATDGVSPNALVQGSDGNFYGTTMGGGQFASGSFFKVTPAGAETILYSFLGTSASSAPAGLSGGILQAGDGNFYGTATLGGEYGQGVVFSIDATGTETIVYSFSGCTNIPDSASLCGSSGSMDGAAPAAGIIQASDGNLYGTTQFGGSSESGTVFKLSGVTTQ